jgi:hypothetical protein
MHKMKQYGVLWLALFAIQSRGSPTECPHLDNCAECSDMVHCDICSVPGIYVLRANGTGCDDCSEVSDGTCTWCTTLTQCQFCSSGRQGPVFGTTTAMCAECAPNCNICDNEGAGKCDANSCDNGFTDGAGGEICSPCAPGCHSCLNFGPGGCDICPKGTGFKNGDDAFHRSGCKACITRNCATCYDDHTICKSCQTGFELNSSGHCVG